MYCSMRAARAIMSEFEAVVDALKLDLGGRVRGVSVTMQCDVSLSLNLSLSLCVSLSVGEGSVCNYAERVGQHDDTSGGEG